MNGRKALQTCMRAIETRLLLVEQSSEEYIGQKL